MAFPNDLSDVAYCKIHPALGCARLANNFDYYEFFDFETRRHNGEPREYMSLRDGNHWIKRQAVRFRIFAYKADGSEAGELTQEIMTGLGVKAKWTAKLANRKLNVWSGRTPITQAQATAGPGETSRLEGKNPWRPEESVWLGDMAGDGTFMPPTGGVYRKSDDKVIPPYSAGATSYYNRDNDVLDTTSDGSISVTLEGGTNLPIVPAAVIVAPQDHSPDVGPLELNPDNDTTSHNQDFVRETRKLLGIDEDAVLPGVGHAMDIAMMNTINADYNPGMEICLDGLQALPNPAQAFYPRGTGQIHPNEIRPSYEVGRAKLGQLTGGLCSTWQTDLTACLNWWTSTYPYEVYFSEEPMERRLSRKHFLQVGDGSFAGNPEAPNVFMRHPEDLNAYMDMMEVGRNLDDDPTEVRGTERTASDTAGPQPSAPYALKPALPPKTTS